MNTFFDRACVYEGRAPRVEPDRGLFQGLGAFGGADVGPTEKVIKVGLNPDGANNHKFRHSFISNLIRSGINVRAVQQLARHESVDITLNTYSHLLQNDLADAVNAI